MATNNNDINIIIMVLILLLTRQQQQGCLLSLYNSANLNCILSNINQMNQAKCHPIINQQRWSTWMQTVCLAVPPAVADVNPNNVNKFPSEEKVGKIHDVMKGGRNVLVVCVCVVVLCSCAVWVFVWAHTAQPMEQSQNSKSVEAVSLFAG